MRPQDRSPITCVCCFAVCFGNVELDELTPLLCNEYLYDHNSVRYGLRRSSITLVQKRVSRHILTGWPVDRIGSIEDVKDLGSVGMYVLTTLMHAAQSADQAIKNTRICSFSQRVGKEEAGAAKATAGNVEKT